MSSKRFFTTWAALIAVALIAVGRPSSALAALDGFNVNSSTFDNLFDGDDIYDGASFLGDWSSAGGTVTPSLSGSTLTVTTPDANGWIQQDTDASAWEGIGDNNWTFEAQLTLSAGDGIALWLDPAASAAGAILYVGSNGVGLNGNGSESDQSLSSDSNIGTNTFRVAYDSDETRLHVWRNDALLSDAIAPTNPGGGPRLIIGDCCSSATTGITVDDYDVEYVRYDTTGAFSPIADAGAVGVTVNRDTGNITLANTSSSTITDIIGYSITSTAGALDQTNWDQQAVGASQLSNDNDDWTVLTGAGTVEDLSEAVLVTSGDGNGGDLAAGSGSVNFGNVWIKSPIEDVAMELLLHDGSSLLSGADFFVTYEGSEITVGDITGAGGSPDGSVNLLDWVEFRGNVGTDIASLSAAQAYQQGDLDGDGVIGATDYNTFVAAYDDANGVGAFAAIPEPATAAMLLVSLGGVLCHRRRRFITQISTPQRARGNMKSKLMGLAAALTCCLAAAPAAAVSDFVIGNYNADNNNPGNAGAIESPLDQGFGRWEEIQQGQTHQGPPAVVQEGVIIGGVNAYRNLDGPVSDPQESTNPGWVVPLTADAQQAMFDFGWQYTLTGVLVQGGHFSAIGILDENPWNLPDDSRIGVAYGVDGGNWSANPVGTGGSNVTVGPLGTAFSQVVITGDPQAVTSTFEVFNFGAGGVGSQIGATQNLTDWAGGNSANTGSFGVQSGSTPGDNREAAHHTISLTVPAPDTLTLRVDTNSGAATLINESGNSVTFNGYFLDSPGGALSTGGWNSLQNQNVGGGTVGQGDGWEEFDSSDNEFLGEGFLTGETTLSNGQSFSLGTLFNPAVFGAGNDGDLDFKLTDAAGRTIPSSLFSTVEYVSGPADPGDYNGDSRVTGADFLIAQRTNPAVRIPEWEANYGNGVPASAAAAGVPEPGTAALLTIAGFALGGASFRRRRESFRMTGGSAMKAVFMSCVAIVAFALVSNDASAEVFNDRFYQLGDDAFGLNADSQGVDTSKFPGAINTGAFQDVTINGSPSTVTGRPGGGLGTQFDGTGDSLTSGQSLNSPNETWNSTAIYPDNGDGYDPPASPGMDGSDSDSVYDPAFPHNYAGIFGRGIQLWAKPDAAGLGQGNRQDLVLDTEEHGIYITENDTWGFQFDCATCLEDTGVAVDTANWTHVMHLGGLRDFAGGGSALDGAMLVNGIAVGARAGFYDASTAGLSIGSNLANDGNYYDGALDEVRIFLYGDNSDEAPAANTEPGYLGGGDWGSLDLGTDNDWIAQQLSSMGVTDRGDVNLSGSVTAADATDFVADWRKVQTVNDVVVGDWISRSQNSDLNYDGITNLQDAFILHESLQAAGLGGLNFALLGVAVPEPTTAGLIVIALSALASGTRRRGV